MYKKLLDNDSQTYYKDIRPQSPDGRKPIAVKFDINIQNIHKLVNILFALTLLSASTMDKNCGENW